ncbi:hypothetical protein [Actinoallomurus sp. CA-150999]|uniref:hypothetical protein n=1 Tax=Actinoallomurus sp. CA-150999 TaxID=3239887 RepID=UPI003D8FBB2D
MTKPVGTRRIRVVAATASGHTAAEQPVAVSVHAAVEQAADRTDARRTGVVVAATASERARPGSEATL